MELVQAATCTGPNFVHVATAVCTSCNLYRFLVQVGTFTKSQLVHKINIVQYNVSLFSKIFLPQVFVQYNDVQSSICCSLIRDAEKRYDHRNGRILFWGIK